MGCWRHARRGRGCDPKMPRGNCRQSSGPLGSQPGTAPLRLCVQGQGQQRPPWSSRGSCPSFSTRQTPVGLLASEMAYFSTVFKAEVTVNAQVREADKDPCFFIWCSAQWDAAACLCGGGGRAVGPSAQVPAEQDLETLIPVSRDRGQAWQCRWG